MNNEKEASHVGLRRSKDPVKERSWGAKPRGTTRRVDAWALGRVGGRNQMGEEAGARSYKAWKAGVRAEICPSAKKDAHHIRSQKDLCKMCNY